MSPAAGATIGITAAGAEVYCAWVEPTPVDGYNDPLVPDSVEERGRTRGYD
jgi:hypothetical protein